MAETMLKTVLLKEQYLIFIAGSTEKVGSQTVRIAGFLCTSCPMSPAARIEGAAVLLLARWLITRTCSAMVVC